MRHYETTYILRPNLGEGGFNEIIERTNAIVAADEGTIIHLDRWGLRKLAYEIKKEVQGYYVYMNYAAAPKTVSEIERIFRIDDRVLRYLTVKLNDAINADGIEAEKERIAMRAAAQAAAETNEDQEEEVAAPQNSENDEEE